MEWREVPCGVEWDFCKRTGKAQRRKQKSEVQPEKLEFLGSKSAALTTEQRSLSSTLHLTRDNPGLTVGQPKRSGRHAQNNASSASKRLCGFFLCTAPAAHAMAPVGPSCAEAITLDKSSSTPEPV